jgi:beta-1,4-mannosyltransferase
MSQTNRPSDQTTACRRVVFAPWVDHPYLDLLTEGLTRVRTAAPVRIARVRRLSPRFAFKLSRHDVVHLQWLDYEYRSAGRPPWSVVVSAAKAGRLAFTIALMRLRGARVVLTVHNIKPHDSPIPLVDAAVAHVVMRLVHVRVVHSAYAKQVLTSRYRRSAPVVVMPFGGFAGAYPPGRLDRSGARRHHGIPDDAKVLLAFGQVRQYKQFDKLIEAFRHCPDPAARLIVAGRAVDGSDDTIRSAAAADSRVMLMLEHIADEDVADLYKACDVAVIPYTEVFSSAALVLALSLGLPAVVPSRGAARELASPPVIIEFESGHLTDALNEALDRRAPLAEMREAALAAVPDVSWERAGRILITEAYDLAGN